MSKKVKQFLINSVDTKVFYNLEERIINYKLSQAKHGLSLLKEYTLIKKVDNKYKFNSCLEYYIATTNNNKYKLLARYNNSISSNIKGINIKEFIDICNKWRKKRGNTYLKKYLTKLKNDNKKMLSSKSFKKEIESNERVKYYSKLINGSKNKKKNINIIGLKEQLTTQISKHDKVRMLNSKKVNKYNAIALFDSFLNRILELNELMNDDLIVIRIFHYPILEQLLKDGFIYNNEKYVFYTASAGQTRNKKVVFMKESLWLKHEKTLMCGLTVDKINNSKEQGCNPNKYLAYLALCNSSTTIWEGFNINECIVVKDFETVVKGTVDYIDKQLKERDIKDKAGNVINKESYYELSDEVERKEMDITITHSDGCGLCLPSISDKNFMVRLPWVKGLITPVDFIEWIKLYNNENYKVTDIYNKEWDLKKDNIKIIFTMSQFKMWKYYESWQDYKNAFIKYNCHASKCNEEKDEFDKANFNYQMWQTLEDMNDEEISEFTNKVDKLITNAYIDKNTQLKLLGATKTNNNLSYFQKILMIYPELLQDSYVKTKLSEIINSKKKEAKYGKLKINATYTFLIPDVVAWLQNLFLKINKPLGLLKDGEVSCKLFDSKKYNELLVNRSPALYKEHCIRKNISNKDIKQWFITDGIYTSSHDLISKTLQFDNDGDKSLVIGDKELVKIAKRNMGYDLPIKNEDGKYNMNKIVPLYYNMGKAQAEKINAKTLYESLTNAYKYGNIGQYSNLLTILWNNNTLFTKEEKLNVAKIITAQNNFSIDSAKTLEMPELSKNLKSKIKQINKIKLPYFFQFAKDKEESKLEKINNSTVNKICKKIESIKQGDFEFKGLSKFDKKKLMCNPKIEINDNVINLYKYLNDEMQKYFMQCKEEFNNKDEDLTKEKIANLVYLKMKEDFVKELNKLNVSLSDATDMIISYIYKNTPSCQKSLLFNVFGDIIISNLNKNIKKPIVDNVDNKKIIQCKCCGKRIDSKCNRQEMCKVCSDKKTKESKAERQRIARAKAKAQKVS